MLAMVPCEQLGVTALMEAANGGFKGIVKELLKSRAKLHKTADGEVAAVSYAKKGKQPEISVCISCAAVCAGTCWQTSV